MPQITIDGRVHQFTPGQMIIQVANAANQAIPQYCYHDGLSIVASCRICLAEVWMPNKQTGKPEPYMGGKLLPTCQTACIDGMVVYTDSPKSVANQKAVMEYLLINHPLDCPVCDQAGECFLQDYSYEYGRGQSRFEETKVKQPKKDLGPHVYLYADRCIMCTRCVRFTREVSGTAELLVSGRGNREEIDVFPGRPIDNELSANVVDLCPVGALLDKDFLFAQRVWFLKSTPSIDGLTASGDNLLIEHNEGKVYRFKPRTNLAVNKWWLTDEVRYGWKFIHREDRLNTPRRRQFGTQVDTDFERATREAIEGLRRASSSGKRIGLLVSPMLSCEEAFILGTAIRAVDAHAFLGVGPIPVHGSDKVFPAGMSENDPKAFKMYAEKCPNSRGVRRVLEALSKASPHKGYVATFDQFTSQLRSGEIAGAVITGNYPSDWTTDALLTALGSPGSGGLGSGGLGSGGLGSGSSGAGGAGSGGADVPSARSGLHPFCVVLDTLPSRLTDRADILLPAATWAEKAGCFENAKSLIQAFEQAIAPFDGARAEGQIATDLLRAAAGDPSLAATGLCTRFNAADTRTAMAKHHADLGAFATTVGAATVPVEQVADMQVVEL